jgi:hypothetical protein
MRSKEFLIEKLSTRSLDSLKNKVKTGIDQTSDETLLHKIYTTLNSGSITKRLTGELEQLPDVDIRRFHKDIANVIINAPGTFEEKMNFVSGLNTGYVDVSKMLDGNRHHFSDLLIPTNKVPLKFLFDMFNEMKDLGGKAKKGPGEFALAIMSPKISIFGPGDLKIANKIIEVKAGSGTVGDTSQFQHSKVAIILHKHLPNVDTTKPIGAEGLSNAVIDAQNQGLLDKNGLDALANELTDYIFKGYLHADLTPLNQAIKSISPNNNAIDTIRRGYLTAAYTAYKQRKEDQSIKFDAMMLINFDNQDLRYFDNPAEMYNDVETVAFSFSHPNSGWAGKLIAPSVNLKREPIVGVEPPKNPTPAAMKAYYGQSAEMMIKMAQQRWPRNLELRNNTSLQSEVAKFIESLASQGVNALKIPKLVKQKFPILNLREPKPTIKPQTTTTKKIPSNPPASNNSQESSNQQTPALKVSQQLVGRTP